MKICDLLLKDKIISAEELQAEVDSRISFLIQNKIPRQSRIIIPTTSGIGTIAWIYACFFSGRVACPIAADTTNDELQDLIHILNPKLVLTATSETAIKITKHKEEKTKSDEVAAILLSSGSSGIPKAVALSMESFRSSANAHFIHNSGAPSDIWLSCLPLFHIGGLSIFTRALFLEQKVAWLPKYEEEKFLAMLLKYAGQINCTSLVPTVLYRLIFSRRDISALVSLKQILVGGSGASDTLLSAAQSRGVKAVQTYGMTEACSQVITGGKVLPGFQLKLAEDGELLVRGEAMCVGYFKNGKKVEKISNKEGFFPTQDLARVDASGDWTILGRKSELIISGGENIFPSEIENVMQELEGVSDCAVCALPDEEWGQKVALAYVADLRGDKITPAAIREYLKKRLSPWKIPKVYKETIEIPRTKNKKIIRQKVENLFHSSTMEG